MSLSVYDIRSLKFRVDSYLPLLFNPGETGNEIIARLKRDLFPTLLNGAMYWPLCDFITFRFIPVHLQVRLG